MAADESANDPVQENPNYNTDDINDDESSTNNCNILTGPLHVEEENFRAIDLTEKNSNAKNIKDLKGTMINMATIIQKIEASGFAAHQTPKAGTGNNSNTTTMLEQEVEKLRKEKEAILKGNEKLWRENEHLKKEQEGFKEHAKDLKEKYSIQHTNCETFEMQQNMLMNILDIPADKRNFSTLKESLENATKPNVFGGKNSNDQAEEWREKFRQANNSLAYQIGVNSTVSSQISEIMTIMNILPQDRNFEHLRLKLEQ